MSPRRLALLAPLFAALFAAVFIFGAWSHKQSWPIYTLPRDAIKKAFFPPPPPPPPPERFSVHGTRWRRSDSQSTGVTVHAKLSAQLASAQNVEEQIRQLQALGYASGTLPSAEDAGVKMAATTQVAESRVMLATDGHAPMAWLMDLHGKTLHTWQKKFDDAFPGNTVPDSVDGTGYFRHVELLPHGELLGIYEGQGVVKLDAASNVLWRYQGAAHHDMQPMPDGSTFVLTRVARVIPRLSKERATLEDYVTHLDPNGKEIHSFSILTAVEDSPYSSLLSVRDRFGDIFHPNSLEVLDGRLASRNPAFAAGNFLISLLKSDAIVVIDAKTERVIWAVGGLSSLQHDANVLDNGRIMVFDNKGDRLKSRVIEIDINTLKLEWIYSGFKHDMLSESCGTAQRLPDGNTLITESDRGRARIVTPAGEKIWEFVTPNRGGPDSQYIATLFEVFELGPEADLSWLKRAP